MGITSSDGPQHTRWLKPSARQRDWVHAILKSMSVRGLLKMRPQAGSGQGSTFVLSDHSVAGENVLCVTYSNGHDMCGSTQVSLGSPT